MKRKQNLVLSRSTRLAIVLSLISISLSLVQTVANPLCPQDQVVIKTAKNSSHYRCSPCIRHCPSGWEPSIPCGGSGISQTCVLCPKDSYKKKHDGSRCIPCTVCEGSNTLRNCSREKNRICSKTCKMGYYRQERLDACLLCSRCCFDGSDKVVDECKSHGMHPSLQCEVGNAQCQQSMTTPLPSTAITTTTTTTTTATSTTPKTAATPKVKNNPPNIKKKTGHLKPTLKDTLSASKTTEKSATVSLVSQNDLDKENNQKTQYSTDPPTEIILPIIASLIVVVLVLVVLLCRSRRQLRVLLMEHGRKSSETKQPEASGRSSEDTELHDTGAAKETKLLEQEEPNKPVNPETKHVVAPLDTSEESKMTLAQLKEKNLDVFDKICKSLNISLQSRPHGDFELIASRYKMDGIDIANLERDQNRGRKVMDFLGAKCPRLKVEEFMQELRRIGRNDIVSILEDFIYVSRSEEV